VLEALFACVVGIALPARAWRRFRRRSPPAPAGRYLLETLLLTGVLAALLWRRGVPLEALGLEPRGSLRFVAEALVCLAVVVGLDAWSVWRIKRSLRAGVVASSAPSGAPVFDDTLAAGRVPQSFLWVTTVGAVWEELCFRATALLLVPRTSLGLTFGILLSSLIFGAQHLRNGWPGLIHASRYGLLFSLLYVAGHNLIAVIIAHAVGNFLAAVWWAPQVERARRAAVRVPSQMFIG
jgi:membrane protease YdiL (CAAX protease family)